MKLTEQFDRLALKRRRVYVWDDIEEALALDVAERLDYLANQRSDPVHLVINSPGGQVSACLCIIDHLRAAQARGVEVRTYVFGEACSAGGFLLAMGTKGHRYVSPFSMVMLHPSSYALAPDYSGNQEKAAAFFNGQERSILLLIAEAIGHSDRKKFAAFCKLVDKGLWLTAEQAVKFGIADAIWTGGLPGE